MFWQLLSLQCFWIAFAAAALWLSLSPWFALLAAGPLAVGWTWCLTKRWNQRLHRAHKSIAALAGVEGRLAHPWAGDDLARLERIAELARQRVGERIGGIDRVRRDLQCMLETIPEAVIVLDAEQRVLFANPGTYRLFDLPEGEIAGQKLWQVLRQSALQDAVTLTFARSEPTSAEFEIRSPPRVVSFRGRGLAVGSGPGVIVVLHDITELRRLERMRQDFFASVSHELKTPLAAIKAYSETLLDDDLADASLVRRFLSRIEEQADRLHALVIDMLMLARVESEDHGFDLQPVEVEAAIAGAIELFGRDAQAKNLVIEVPRHEPCLVLADPEGVGMILRNLIDNAIKYTPAGGRIRVWADREGPNILLRVQDTGIGIPPRDLSRIFERFYRVDKARSRELGGTGLGLSIVKHLTQQFEGRVSVQSRLHEGSTFTVTLPAAPAGGSPGATTPIEQEALV